MTFGVITTYSWTLGWLGERWGHFPWLVQNNWIPRYRSCNAEELAEFKTNSLFWFSFNQLQKFPVLITQSFTHMLLENAQLASSNNLNSGQHQPIPHLGNGRILPLGYIWPWTKKQLSLDLVKHFFRKIGFELRLAKLSGISLPGVSKIGMILFTSKGNKYKNQVS